MPQLALVDGTRLVAGLESPCLVELESDARRVDWCEDGVIPILTRSTLKNETLLLIDGIGHIVDGLVEPQALQTVASLNIRGIWLGGGVAKSRGVERAEPFVGKANTPMEPGYSTTGLNTNMLRETTHVTHTGSPSGFLRDGVSGGSSEVHGGGAKQKDVGASGDRVGSSNCNRLADTYTIGVGPRKHSITFLF